MSRVDPPRSTRRVGLIGCGAIGRVVADELVAGRVPGAELVGVSARRPIESAPAPQLSVDRLIERCDIVVEAAGHEVVRQHAADILSAGCDLVLVSLGALSVDEVADRIRRSGPGRAIVCTGAIGGVDLIRAATLVGGMRRLQLTTTKRPGVLISPWMDGTLTARLEQGEERVVVFEGSAREAAPRFPRSINVAATLALAVGDWDMVEVRVVADPEATLTHHHIEVEADSGRYRFEIVNRPSETNPATSAVVPYAVLRALADRAGSGFVFA